MSRTPTRREPSAFAGLVFQRDLDRVARPPQGQAERRAVASGLDELVRARRPRPAHKPA